MQIKICGITNLEDALGCVEAGADLLGFNFYPRSPRFISPEKVRDICRQLPAHVRSIGVFVDCAHPEEVAQIADLAELDGVQLHGDESPAYCAKLNSRFVIKALRIGSNFDVQQLEQYSAQTLLLDSLDREFMGGTGKSFDWGLTASAELLNRKFFLAGGLSPDNVQQAIRIVKPFGIDACSKLERALGVKDLSLVRAFVRNARAVVTES